MRWVETLGSSVCRFSDSRCPFFQKRDWSRESAPRLQWASERERRRQQRACQPAGERVFSSRSRFPGVKHYDAARLGWDLLLGTKRDTDQKSSWTSDKTESDAGGCLLRSLEGKGQEAVCFGVGAEKHRVQGRDIKGRGAGKQGQMSGGKREWKS